jgi:transposase-like protein
MNLIECPLCTGNAELHIEKRIRSFRKEDYNILEYYYKCKNCGEDFTNSQIDELNVHQVYNLYREKYSIPSPEQLKSVRERYDISLTKMSRVLGFGPNQYRLYESGEIPSESNGTILSFILRTKNFKSILEKKKSVIKNSEKIINHLDQLIADEARFDLMVYFFNPFKIPNQFTGFTPPNFNKFANMVCYFISNAPFKTRLNKLLFYSDFAAFKYLGRSISGSEYAAIQNGPVPEQYEYKFSLLEDHNIISLVMDTYHGKEVEKFECLIDFNEKLFTVSEIEIMKNVLTRFRFLKTQEIIEASHNEFAWKENEASKRKISYLDYAPLLLEI